MADENTTTYVPEKSEWAEGVRMITTADAVVGGVDGPPNKAYAALANRTVYLKDLCAKLAASIPGTEEFEKIYAEIANLDVTKLDGRVDHLERLTGNIMLSLQAANMSPTGYDSMMTETFNNAEEIDQTIATVTSVVSGDDSIDVSSASGIVIGNHYQLTDGEAQEEVQVKSINIAGTTNRVILESPVVNQYAAGKAKLYRSSVAIYNGRAYGGGSIKTDTWEPKKSFSGATTAQDVTTTTNYTSTAGFEVDGATVEAGKIILGAAAFGIAMVSQGSTAGVWQKVDENGDDLA